MPSSRRVLTDQTVHSSLAEHVGLPARPSGTAGSASELAQLLGLPRRAGSSRTDETDWTIYELPQRKLVERRVESIQLSEPLPTELIGRHIDRPREGALTDAMELEVIGWVQC